MAMTLIISLHVSYLQAQNVTVCPAVITDNNTTPTSFSECWTERHEDIQEGKASGVYQHVITYLSGFTTISAENKAIIANVVANRMAYKAGIGVTGLAVSYGAPPLIAGAAGFVAAGYVYDGTKYVFKNIMDGTAPSLNTLAQRAINSTQSLLYSLHQQGIALAAEAITAATLEGRWVYPDVRFTSTSTSAQLTVWNQIDSWEVSSIVPGTVMIGTEYDEDGISIYQEYGGALTYQVDNTTGDEAPPTPHRWNYDGDIVARRIAVSNDVDGFKDWADYVFEEDYELRSISEVEAYIKENGHLPEVLSTTEVKEQGLDLVDMDITLLKKVEELTLYIIDQEKRMLQQEARIRELEQRLIEKSTGE